LSLLGPGSPVLVGGNIGWVIGAGSGHQPGCRRQASGHARSPGAAAAVSVDLHGLRPEWVRPCFFEGHGSALLIAIAAPVPLINAEVARQAAAGPQELEAPVLDLSVPRRIKPSLGSVSYAELLSGTIQVAGRSVACAPSHSPRLAAAACEALIAALIDGSFPLRLPVVPLSSRPSLLPIEA
jgi:L-aspartate semialdehyde sulfurtransferase